MDEYLNNILLLYNNTMVILDKKEKKVTKALSANKEIANNSTYEDFVDAFIFEEKLDKQNRNKIVNFFNNLNFKDYFSVPANYKNINGDDVEYVFKGLEKETYIIIIISNQADNNIYQSTDSLTKLFNHQAINMEGQKLLKDNIPFILIMMDVDDFKLFNDNYGHSFGDIILVDVAASIKTYVGEGGFVGRIGGDEFLIIYKVDELKGKTIYEFTSGLKSYVKKRLSEKIDNVSVTSTYGVARYPEDGTTLEEVFNKADSALYRGKRKGRDCFIIYDKSKAIEFINTTTNVNKEVLQQYSNHANIIAAIFELIISKTGNFEKKINNALELISNYFLIERTSLFINEPENPSVFKKAYCYVANEKIQVVGKDFKKDYYAMINKYFQDKEYVKISQVKSNEDHPIYEVLKGDGTSAILSFKLQFNDKHYGYSRFEMCSINRFWQSSEISALMLISKLFSIAINNDYIERQMDQKLHYDKITGIYNYSKWRDEVSDTIVKNEAYTIISLSIVNFSKLNYIKGTKYCDNLLRALANAIRANSKGHIFCRSNNDNFLIYINDTNKINIINFLDKLDNTIKDISSNQANINAGIYQGCDEFEVAIDRALLTKLNANNTFRFYSDELFHLKQSETEIELRFDEALQQNEFKLFLQPKMDMRTDTVIGAEALSRWKYKNQEILYPAKYIYILEGNHKIKYLDYYMFRKVCEFQKNIINQGYRPLPISVNVSRFQENYQTYLNTIEEIRLEYDLPSSLFEIEITESMGISTYMNLIGFINDLHACGYKVSMDDFGTGYSNFSSLAELDVDIIKLDQSFARKTNTIKERKILDAIMKLAKNLNIDVICEGVETEDYKKFLLSINCIQAQGFLYDKPIADYEFINKYLKKINCI